VTDRFEERLARAAASTGEAGLSGLLVAPGPDLAYLAGYAPPPLERLTLLRVTPGADPVLIVPTLERPAAEASPIGGRIEIRGWTDGEDPYASAAALLDGGGRYALSDQTWASHLLGLQGAAPGATFVASNAALPLLRAIKDDDELARLAAAGAAADAAFADVVGHVFAGRRERDVAGDLAELLRTHGHQTADFTIVASGPNGASPHHDAGDRVIGAGDPVVLDFGGFVDGYGSDTTRTVVVGEPPGGFDEVYAAVHRAQQAAFEAVRPGVPCEEIDRAARTVIEEAGFGERFIHRTGHGIGLTTHEPPYLVTGNREPLAPGMCFSIEPGIYLPDRFGVRIEDIVAVTENGARRFNLSTRELQTVR
jgi:D-alanyl-D-alanine dipeptidase